MFLGAQDSNRAQLHCSCRLWGRLTVIWDARVGSWATCGRISGEWMIWLFIQVTPCPAQATTINVEMFHLPWLSGRTWGPGHKPRGECAVCPLPSSYPWKKTQHIILGAWKPHLLLWHKKLNTVPPCACLPSCELSSSLVASSTALWAMDKVALRAGPLLTQCDLCDSHTVVWMAFHNRIRTSLGRMWEESCLCWT